MSRIQEILKKAERDGGVHRTRAIVPDRAAGSVAHALVEPPTVDRPDPGIGRAEPAGVGVETAPIGFVHGAPRQASGHIDSHLVAAGAPQSIAAEQYRLLRTRVTRAENGRSYRAIIITSPNKGDGKSLTAANLALTMAQDPQQRVLLLDADLRRPSIHRLFGIDETPGLTDVLMGGASLEEALVSMPDYRLTVLPSGGAARVARHAPGARHLAFAVRSHSHRHAAGGAARRRRDRVDHRGRRADDRARGGDAEAGDRARARQHRQCEGSRSGTQ
jgi:hypothetical protein